MKILSIPFLLCLLLAVSGNFAWSAQQDSVQPSSRKAYIDEATGELISAPAPDSEQDQNPDAASLLQEQDIEYITHPDGTVEGKLNGHFQSHLTVTLDCDGSVTKSHSDNDPDRPDPTPLEDCETRE